MARVVPPADMVGRGISALHMKAEFVLARRRPADMEEESWVFSTRNSPRKHPNAGSFLERIDEQLVDSEVRRLSTEDGAPYYRRAALCVRSPGYRSNDRLDAAVSCGTRAIEQLGNRRPHGSP